LPTIPNNTNLFFIAEGKTNDPFDLPDLNIKRGNDSWSCNRKDGSDLCLIDHSNIKENDEF
jgi:hypothetical protein